MTIVDRDLGVVAVDEAVGLAEHDPALGIGEVALSPLLGQRVGITAPLAGLCFEGSLGLADLRQACLTAAQLLGR